MNLALYIMSAAISIRRMRYMVSKYFSSSDFVAVTVVSGASMWCATYGLTCTHQQTLTHLH